eukprot:Sspe_Gene.39821::Locus_19202_Transcript_1_1_Confidence_1.000_Length_1731::g.39821::m.39821
MVLGAGAVVVVEPPASKAFELRKMDRGSLNFVNITYKSTVGAMDAAEFMCTYREYVAVVSPSGKNNSVYLFKIQPDATVLRTHVIPITGTPNSCYIYKGILAVAVSAANVTQPGTAEFFKVTDGMSIASIAVGPLPDHISMTPDRSAYLVANEGEPEREYSSPGFFADPAGGVSIIRAGDWMDNKTYTVCTVPLQFANPPTDAEFARKKMHKAMPRAGYLQDFEPEYIGYDPADSTKAYVTLQENNAIMIVDVSEGKECSADARVLSFNPLGWKDWSIAGNVIDPSNKDAAGNFRNEPVYSLYQPDTIKGYRVGGHFYLVTANEGDSKSTDDFKEGEEARGKDLSFANPLGDYLNVTTMLAETNLGRMKVTTEEGKGATGNDYTAMVGYGGRSFAIWKVTPSLTELVFDSSGMLDQLAKEYSDSVGGGLYDDGREDDKGTEPEGLEIVEINERVVLFLGLERALMVCSFDITAPEQPEFMECKHNPKSKSMDRPEALAFSPSGENPTPWDLLLVTGEESKDLSIYSIHHKARPSAASATAPFLLLLLLL